MKVIFCQPGEDPMVVARRYKTERSSAAGDLLQYWWLLAVVLFAVYTFTAGPLKPKKDTVNSTPSPQPTAQIAGQTELVRAEVDEFTGYCKNPAGGMFPPGATVYLADGDTVKQVRCDDGQWVGAEDPAP